MSHISRAEWTGVLQDAAADLNAIIDEIASGDLVFENLETSQRSELEYLSHRVNELRDMIVADAAALSASAADPYREFRLRKADLI